MMIVGIMLSLSMNPRSVGVGEDSKIFLPGR